MTKFVIPYQFDGKFVCEASSEQEARELFDTMSRHELAQDADFWSDDRTFTEEGYARAIKAVTEPAE